MFSFIHIVCVFFSIAGGILSFYFYFVYQGILKPQFFLIPKFLQLNTKTCISIVDTNYGRIFKYPNALIGGIFYFCCIPILVYTYYGFIKPFIIVYLTLSALIIGVYLLYGLYKLQILCRICITAHLINSINLILLLYIY